MSDRREQQPLVPPHDVEARAETEPRDVPQAAIDGEPCGWCHGYGYLEDLEFDITYTCDACLGTGVE